MSDRDEDLYEFGPFRLMADKRLFFKGEDLIPLTPKALDLLIVLVKRNGQVVEKDELMTEVWPETYVSESSLTHNIHQLRKVLNDDSNEHTYIETVPRRGYRFKAEFNASISAEPETADTPVELTSEKEIDEKGTPAAAITPLETRPNRGRLSWGGGRKTKAAFICIILLMTASFVVWVSQRKQSADVNVRPRSVAVLPFKSIGGNDEQSGLGMANALIVKLSSLNQLNVLPTSAISRFVQNNQDAISIGRDLEVDAVIDGTMQTAGDRVQVTVQVIDVKNGQTIWQARFDEKLTDVFTVQAALSEQIAETFALKLTGDDRKLLAKKYTNVPEAYRFYSMGLYFWEKRTKDSLAKAIENFERAIEQDPNYVLAYAGLADSYFMLSYYDYMNAEQRRECHRKVKELNDKALSIDPAVGEVYVISAGIKIFDRDVAGADADYKRALALSPNSAVAHSRYASFLFQFGSRDEALQHLRRARDLDPLSALINLNLAYYLYYLRQYDEALKYCLRALDLEPDIARGRLILGMIYLGKKMYPEAIAEFKQVTGYQYEKDLTPMKLCYAYVMTGKTSEANEILTHLEEVASQKRLAPGNEAVINMAEIYSALGQKDKAFGWLNRLHKDTALYSLAVMLLKVDPQLDELRSDPRFEALLQHHSNSNDR